MRAAAVVIAWNVLPHFYPHHDVIGEDWSAVLARAIEDVLDDAGPEDLSLTLRRLVHRLHDGHGRVIGQTGPPAVLPIRLALVDGVYVVLAADPSTGIQRGDELVSTDGVAAADLHARGIELTSGSPQWSDDVLLAQGSTRACRSSRGRPAWCATCAATPEPAGAGSSTCSAPRSSEVDVRAAHHPS